MDARELVKSGALADALSTVEKSVRGAPADPRHRIFLFQLLCIDGAFDRAMTQLKVVAELDAKAIPMAQMYGEAIRNEDFRREVFAGRRSPLIFGEPPSWVGLMIEALRVSAEGRVDAAEALRAEALEAAPAVGGTVNGESFGWIADADSRLGPLLEAIVEGRYYWIPFERIRKVDIEPPEDLRDFVWTPTHFTWSNGGEAIGLIPTRYSGSERSDDPMVRLGRKTDWAQTADQTFVGVGQRMLATDGGEHALLDIRSIEIASA